MDELLICKHEHFVELGERGRYWHVYPDDEGKFLPYPDNGQRNLYNEHYCTDKTPEVFKHSFRDKYGEAYGILQVVWIDPGPGTADQRFARRTLAITGMYNIEVEHEALSRD